MRQVEASAPGKAVLIGEYAVLQGTPALVMAVNRRVRVQLRACPADACRLEAPQLAAEPFAFRLEPPRRLIWSDRALEHAELALCRNVLARALEAGPDRVLPAPGGLCIRIDSGELFEAGQGATAKLGLGSSAAVTVALSAALARFLHVDAQEAEPLTVDRLLDEHRQSQGGRGSGLDLAASLAGGVIAYRLSETGAVWSPLSWPADWPLLFAWTGEGASTGHFLERYAAWRGAQPRAAADLWQAMDDCAGLAMNRLAAADLEQFMTCVNQYGELMGKMGDCIKAPVVSARHRSLAALAIKNGAAYKPCGAGGGDLGMFIAPDHRQLAHLRRDLVAHGFGELDLAPALSGLELRATDTPAGLEETPTQQEMA